MNLKSTASILLFPSFIVFLGLISPFPANAADRWDIVQPAEMTKSQQWFDHQLDTLTGKTKSEPPLFRGISQGWGTFQIGWSVNHLPIKLNGKIHEIGIASHADGIVEMRIPPGSKRLTGICGLDDTKEDRETPNPVWFSIEADGKEIWRTKPTTAANSAIPFDIDLTAIKIITLKGTGVGQLQYTPLDWADLKLTQADNSIRELGQRLDFQTTAGNPISFTYDSKPSEEFLNNWTLSQETIPTTNGATLQRITRTDPITGLQCTIDLKRYPHFPVIEWAIHFKNTGNKDTPILENIHSMDLAFPAVDKLTLHHNNGGQETANAYEPHLTDLKEGTTLHFAPNGGRPTDAAWPYYNIEDPTQNAGVIAVVGWSGQWSADFSRSVDNPGTLRISAGQQLTHLRLHPGEEIRTPLSIIMLYAGDAQRGQNIWRRWMLEDNLPKIDNQLPPAIFASSMGLHQSEKTELDAIKMYTDHGIRLTHWWMDAGWYPCINWWDGVGSWFPDPQRFPQGIKPISDFAHANNMQLILWFEPERVHIDTWLYKNHPEWLLGNTGDSRLLNIGDPAAYAWLLNHLDEQITQQGVDLYRQDFNEESLGFWRANDSPDRQGITEIRHVEAYLALWDELHRRHPKMWIDTCASGGRRLDIETLRRSIPLWRCDHNADNESNQCQTFALASWVPLFGSGISCDDPYTVRSQMIPFLALEVNDAKNNPWELFNQESQNWLTMRDEMLGDFYPLLPYNLDKAQWMAWQFDRAENSTGVIEAFRHPNSPFSQAKFPLQHLDASASYEITDLDSPQSPVTITGTALMSDGIEIKMDQRPAAKIFLYRKK